MNRFDLFFGRLPIKGGNEEDLITRGWLVQNEDGVYGLTPAARRATHRIVKHFMINLMKWIDENGYKRTAYGDVDAATMSFATLGGRFKSTKFPSDYPEWFYQSGHLAVTIYHLDPELLADAIKIEEGKH